MASTKPAKFPCLQVLWFRSPYAVQEVPVRSQVLDVTRLTPDWYSSLTQADETPVVVGVQSSLPIVTRHFRLVTDTALNSTSIRIGTRPWGPIPLLGVSSFWYYLLNLKYTSFQNKLHIHVSELDSVVEVKRIDYCLNESKQFCWLIIRHSCTEHKFFTVPQRQRDPVQTSSTARLFRDDDLFCNNWSYMSVFCILFASVIQEHTSP